MIDFSDAPTLKKGYGGANGNKISILYDNSRWMLKFPSLSERNPNLYYSKGCVTEYLGSHIFQSVGIKTQDTLLGTYRFNGKSKTVVACKDFVDPGFELQDFASLKNQIISSDRSGYGTELGDITETFHKQKIMDPDELESHFWDMFVVDSLIGNWDRHNGNWGFLYDTANDTMTIAPVYDCGSSLFPETDPTLQKEILGNKAAMHKRLYSVPTSSILINGKRINYFNFLSSLENKHCNAALTRIVPQINMDKIMSFIQSTPGLSNLEVDFYNTILQERKDKIVDFSLNKLAREKPEIYISKTFKKSHISDKQKITTQSSAHLNEQNLRGNFFSIDQSKTR